jgi:1-deoxy-D-xylulose-5-phosphate synthase
MLDFALEQDQPTAIRYPKATAKDLGLSQQPIELGKGQIVRWGTDGALIALGPMVEMAMQAAEQMSRQGMEIAVINPRFIKPLDIELFERIFSQCKFVITLEEAALMGGFGSALLEAACDHGWDTTRMRRVGIPDRFIEHGERDELLADLGLSTSRLAEACVEMSGSRSQVEAGDHLQVGSIGE